MPEHYRVIQAGRWADKMRSLVGARGAAALTEFSEELRAVVLLEGERPETEILAGVRLWTMRITTSAVAAQFGHVLILNPSDSGILAVIEDAWRTDDNVTDVFVGIRYRGSTLPPAGFAQSNLINRDSRNARSTGGTGGFGTQVWFLTDATTVYGISFIDELYRSSLAVPRGAFPHVLGPGDGLTFDVETANISTVIHARGYERVLERGEFAGRRT